VTALPADQSRQTAIAYLRLIVIAALIGIPAALVAALFLALIHEMQLWLWTELPATLGFGAPPWYLVLGLPVVGALLVVVARAFLPGNGGHTPLQGLSAEPTPPSHVPGVVLAAIGSLAFGIVLGPEMPVIALGTAIGIVVERFVRVVGQERQVIANAGAFSAISALFGGPLVAGMLLIESGLSLGPALIPAMLPGLVAAGMGYLVFVGVGTWEGLAAPGLQIPSLPPYQGIHPGDLSFAVLVGVATVALLFGVREMAVRVVHLESRVGMPVLLVAGGVAVGALALGAQLLGADSQDVLFSGQASLGVVTGGSLAVVLILLVAKSLAYAVSLGSGFRGGPIFPAVFLGVAIASIFVTSFGSSPTWAISVGAAAGMAAQTRLIISPLLFASLLIGPANSDTIPATVLATAAAWITITALDRRGHEASADRSTPRGDLVGDAGLDQA
jgi:H+/Cl- antiporter ClcA